MNENKREVKVAGIQMHCKENSKEYNLKKALKYIDQAANDGAKIICLQESFNTEWSCYKPERFPAAFEYGEPIPGPTINKISEKAMQYCVYIIAPILEKTISGVYYNTATLIGPNGEIIGKHRKMHIGSGGSEKLFFTPGSEANVFKTEYGNIGIMTCYDRNFTELWRILALKGAEMIFLPYATWWSDCWEWLNRATAFQNIVFAIHVNRVGKEGDSKELNFFGRSLIIDPEGEIIAKAGGEDDEIVAATIDLEDVKRTRINRALYRDRRPELYGRILDPPSFL